MLSILKAILCVLEAIAEYVLLALVTVVNLLVVAVGALIALVLAALPDFPSEPGDPPGGIVGVLNWVVPLGPLLAGFAVLLTCWLTFLLIRIALRWVKAL